MTEDRRCATCANWLPHRAPTGRSGVEAGECHRYAPHPLVIRGEEPGGAHVAWPVTRAGDSCGEWFYGGERTPRPVVVDTTRAADATAAGPEEPMTEEILPAS
jgi:hypothetical protein